MCLVFFHFIWNNINGMLYNIPPFFISLNHCIYFSYISGYKRNNRAFFLFLRINRVKVA